MGNCQASGREQAREKNESLVPIGVVLPPPGFAQPADMADRQEAPSE